MAFSKESRDLVDEIYKIAHSEDTVVDEDAFSPIVKILHELLNAKVTIKDFAKANNISESNLKTNVSRKYLGKPIRAVLYCWSKLSDCMPKNKKG